MEPEYRKRKTELKVSIISVIVMYGLLRGCEYFGREADTLKNTYTINHREYNMLILWWLTRHFISESVLNILAFQDVTSTGTCSYLYRMTLVLVRLAILGYMYGFLMVSVCFMQVVPQTWHLNNKNWWKTSEEPFFTNCSLFNAAVCWLLWLTFIINILTFVIMVTIMTLAYIFTICKIGHRRSWRRNCYLWGSLV